MKVSLKGDYAVRAMVDLSVNYGKGPVTIQDIAKRQHIPPRFLEQILLSLKRVGLLVSKKGIKGGYFLARPPEKIKVGDVIRAIDGPLTPIDCVEKISTFLCHEDANCQLKHFWEKVTNAISHVVDNTSFADLCDMKEEKG